MADDPSAVLPRAARLGGVGVDEVEQREFAKQPRVVGGRLGGGLGGRLCWRLGEERLAVAPGGVRVGAEEEESERRVEGRARVSPVLAYRCSDGSEVSYGDAESGEVYVG